MRATDAQTVDLQEGKTVTVTLKLHKGLSVAGTVTDAQGKPAAGVRFFLAMPGNTHGVSGTLTTTVLFL